MSIYDEVKEQVRLARVKHRQEYNSRHEGYAIILEEVDEAWDAIKGNRIDPELRIELLHVAAVAIRFIEDLL